MPAPPQLYPVRLTQAQRRVLSEVAPELAPRLKVDGPGQRTISLTAAEWRTARKRAAAGIRRAQTATVRNSLRRVLVLAIQALDRSKGIGAARSPGRLCQFKITLVGAQPPIWRRIRLRECTLDKLHEHVQTAMGWTNSHLHRFKIAGRDYGDPQLLHDGFDDYDFADSTTTNIKDVVPMTGEGFAFEYEYDFGDGWRHEVVFEGCVRAEPGGRYPVCVAGARACPPEDVGGVWGYREYLKAMADPGHKRHEEFMDWRGPFDPEAFDAARATREMRRGLPDWRSEEWF